MMGGSCTTFISAYVQYIIVCAPCIYIQLFLASSSSAAAAELFRPSCFLLLYITHREKSLLLTHYAPQCAPVVLPPGQHEIYPLHLSLLLLLLLLPQKHNNRNPPVVFYCQTGSYFPLLLFLRWPFFFLSFFSLDSGSFPERNLFCASHSRALFFPRRRRKSWLLFCCCAVTYTLD